MHEGKHSETGIYYRANDWRAERPTLVFLHGLSGSSSAWKPFEEHFNERCNTISLDLRGHGASRVYPRADDYAIPLFADDVAHVLRSLSATHIHIVGHSLGASVAVALFADSRIAIEKMTLFSPAYQLFTLARFAFLYPFLFFIRIFINLLPIEKNASLHRGYSKYRGAADWDFERIWNDISATSFRVYLYSYLATIRFSGDHRWRKLLRTHVIQGTKDAMVPFALAKLLKRNAPHITLTLADVNHIVTISNPCRAIALLENDLSD